MALSIASVPVLTGRAADRFDDMLKLTEQRRGSVDFSEKVQEARRILSKANITCQ